ncbi:hypothetical protein DOTSEDRAFT_20493 [Dothistroma septosporum NZE10]|uniref:Uncharacterized protein n=1 Tax=Dothistroma septosporum (strain NZE10 / CBS 128990) TaxID=675120 RepID=N1Q355_DOTSN|nr:hypothetical protein DOTSEDRAFT_20493 [Dothistroma septosporum NZE10]
MRNGEARDFDEKALDCLKAFRNHAHIHGIDLDDLSKITSKHELKREIMLPQSIETMTVASAKSFRDVKQRRSIQRSHGSSRGWQDADPEDRVRMNENFPKADVELGLLDAEGPVARWSFLPNGGEATRSRKS